MSLQATQDESMRRRRPHHASRTAESHAAFLLPLLRPGMDLLDLGCGPCSITAGLAAAVAPGVTVGLDIDPRPAEGVRVVAGDVMHLPFPDGSFDAIHAGALLQHLAEPLAALREARRVARPGAVIGIVDADWDGELLFPTSAVLARSMEVARKLREGTSPFVGKQLRHLLTETGFSDARGSARVIHHGTSEETREFGSFNAALFRMPAAAERVTSAGWATAGELEEMSQAWTEWGEHPGAFVARFWCEAIAFR